MPRDCTGLMSSDEQSRLCWRYPLNNMLVPYGLNHEQDEHLIRKEQSLNRLVRDRKISKREAKQRLIQSLADRQDEHRGVRTNPDDDSSSSFTSGLRRAARKKTLPNTYLLTLLDPELHMCAIPDTFSLFPRTVERIKTQFTASPDNLGNFGMAITAGRNSIRLTSGTISYNGIEAGYGTPVVGIVSPYKWSTFDGEAGGSAVACRLVANKVIISYEGPLTDSSGRIAVCQYPIVSNTPAYGFDYNSVASYDYSYSGPISEGAAQISLPGSSEGALEWRSTNTTFPEYVAGVTAVAVAGLTGGVSGAVGATRLNIKIYSVYEFNSVDPILTGGTQLYSPPAVLAEAAHFKMRHLHQQHETNGKAASFSRLAERLARKYAHYTWGQRQWMWNATREYGPKIAEFAAVNIAAGM